LSGTSFLAALLEQCQLGFLHPPGGFGVAPPGRFPFEHRRGDAFL
jgi:hypothetical protein